MIVDFKNCCTFKSTHQNPYLIQIRQLNMKVHPKFIFNSYLCSLSAHTPDFVVGFSVVMSVSPVDSVSSVASVPASVVPSVSLVGVTVVGSNGSKVLPASSSHRLQV
jgi:hypothetical protein